jgi:D-alanyl-D-alanine carboxypeptidase/D-alanyl-D-alanine-endopeptidase (penicillin-binding protein 4)
MATRTAAPTPTPTAATSWTTSTLPGLDAIWTAFDKVGVRSSEVALLAQPLATDTFALAAHNEQLPVTMASTTKVMTTLAGLQLLPATFRWQTRAWLDGPLVEGSLQGDLILLGGGDATLDSQALQGWFARLHKKGLTHIQGRIVLDQSMYRLTEKDHANTPVPEAGNPHHAWPDAFVVDQSRFEVRLNRAADDTLQARFEPALEQVALVSQFTGHTRCTAQARFEPAEPLSAATAASAVDLTPVGTTSAPLAPLAPLARVVLSGQWHAGCKNPITMEAVPGRALSSALVAGAWVASGGTLAGTVVHREPAAAAPRTQRPRKPKVPYAGKPWDTLRSMPLPELVQAINKTSNNLMARSLLLSIAPGFSPTTSTLQLARQRIDQWFAKVGLVHAAPYIDNGSGLAHNEQASALQLVQLMQQAWAQPRVQSVFLASLPIAGADGTLGSRFRNSPAQRQAFLKTGTLTGVRSLAGYVRGKSGQMIAVTIIVNSPRASAAVPAMDRFIEWVVDNG